MSATGLDRRARRHRETIEEILDVAVRLMETEGVAALSLSAVARQLGMQPPSLYQYFPSKMAIYDAVFQRAGELVRAASRRAYEAAGTDDLLELDLIAASAFCRWCMEHPVHSQLMLWRVVPGFEPSVDAVASAEQSAADLRTHLRSLVDGGRLHPDAVGDEGVALYISLLAGLLSQQMTTDPRATFEDGRYMRLLPTVLAMFYQRYAVRGDG